MTLDQLAIKHGTDKSSKHHNYCVIYEKYFEALRNKTITLFEIGYGGYAFPDRGGQSARMWLEYFPNAYVFVKDIYNKTNLPIEHRFTFFFNNEYFNGEIYKIIIDDGSHINTDTISNFESYWPNVVNGGIYVIEDTETSYWEDIATDGTDFKGTRNTTDLTKQSVMNYFKLKADDLNLIETDIETIHFYKGLIFIIKKWE